MLLLPRTRRLLLWLGATAVAALALRQAQVEAWGPWQRDAVRTDSTAPQPLGAAAYAQRLAQEAGGKVAPAALAERARAVAAELEAMLDERARRLDPAATDWRPVYRRLQDDTPQTGEEILAAYRVETERALTFCRERGLVPLPPRSPSIYAIENTALRRLFPLAMNRGDGTLGITLEPPEGEGDVAGYRRNHCRVCIPPIAVHETYPGHHVAFALVREGSGGGASGRWPFFHEGWAQYAEVLMWEEGYWQADPAREPAIEPAIQMGALHLMLRRATRAEVDAGLHGGGLLPEAARRIYVERLLIDEAAAASEVTGHLQSPAKKASYLIGALQLLALRDALGRPRGAALRSFHERFLRRADTIPGLARREFGVEIPVLPARRLLPLSP